MSLRRRLALTVFLTGLVAGTGVLITLALALERAERENTFSRANAFVQRLDMAHPDLLARVRNDAQGLTPQLRQWLLFESDTQLYILDGTGTILARTGSSPLPPDFRVRMTPVREAAQWAQRSMAEPGRHDEPLYIMGDDPERMEAGVVIAAKQLQDDDPAATQAHFVYVVCRPPGAAGSRLAQLSRQLNASILTPLLVVALLATLLAIWIIDTVTRPLARLSREVDALAHSGLEGGIGRLSPVVPWNRHDEIGKLQGAFDQLLARLRDPWMRMQDLDAFRREGVSNLSHDLRSPLTAAVASLETLLQRWQGGERATSADAASRTSDQHLLEVALRNNRMAANLVRALGDLAVLDEAGYRLRPMRLDVLEMLDDIATRFVERARSAGVQLRVDAGDAASLPAQVDVELFERALANLVDNAIRHSSSGGRVVLSAARHGDELSVQVRDEGCGISPDDLARIFSRHQQGHHRRGGERPAGGHGLGLAIVKRIIELHGGRVELSSVVDRGTIVTLTWPAELPAPKLMDTPSSMS